MEYQFATNAVRVASRHLPLLLLACLGCDSHAQKAHDSEWSMQLTVTGWAGRHIIIARSDGAYSFRRIRLGDVQEEKCGFLTRSQVGELQEKGDVLRQAKDQLPETWPPVGLDGEYAMLHLSWPSSGEEARFELPLLPAPGPVPNPPPDLLRELVVSLWNYRASVEGDCTRDRGQ